jgi:hypothetical protein
MKTEAEIRARLKELEPFPTSDWEEAIGMEYGVKLLKWVLDIETA